MVSDGGDRFILKIANADEPMAVLDLQSDTLAFLADRDIGIELPRTVPTKTGDRGLSAPGQDGDSHWVRLLTYVKGEVLGTVRPRTPALLESLGEAIGRLDAVLSGFDHPAAVRRATGGISPVPPTSWPQAFHISQTSTAGRRSRLWGARSSGS